MSNLKQLVSVIKDNIFRRDFSLGNSNATIKTNQAIVDNHDLFKAHIVIFGNRQYLAKLFGYKNKEVQKNFGDFCEKKR